MATFTGSGSGDTANATTGTLTGFSGGTQAQLQDNVGDTFTGNGGADTIVAGSGDDTITGGSGADTIVAGNGDDTINIANGEFVTGELIAGGADSGIGTRDRIVLTNATTVNFSLGTVSAIETLTGSSGNDVVAMTASQWGGFSAINLGSGSDTLNVVASGNITVMVTPTISGIEIGNLTGTSGTDTITLTGAQLDAIIIGSGTINLSSGSGDTINLTSTSSDLNSLGATNASISGVEAISAAGATPALRSLLAGRLRPSPLPAVTRPT